MKFLKSLFASPVSILLPTRVTTVSATPALFLSKQQAVWTLIKSPLPVSKTGCAAGDFTLPAEVSEQARKVADYMSGIDLEKTDKGILKSYWDELDDAQKTFR